MTSKKRYKRLYLEEEIGTERVFEIMIRDIKQRGEKKKASFSIIASKGIGNNEYPSVEEMKEILKELVKKEMKKYE